MISPMDDFLEAVRLTEALLFAAEEPLAEADIAKRLPASVKVAAVIERLQLDYAGRGVEPTQVGGRWIFRTAPDLGSSLALQKREERRLSRAMEETLAIIAYHQPVTRPEIEAIRGVSLGRGTLDALLDTGWVKPGPRKEVPGRPLTWLTTPAFLEGFGLAALSDLPGVEELRTAGLLETGPMLSANPMLSLSPDSPDAPNADEN
jgi:segregation and condensation protein B